MTKVSRLHDTQPPPYTYVFNTKVDKGHISYTDEINQPSRRDMSASNIPPAAVLNRKHFTKEKNLIKYFTKEKYTQDMGKKKQKN